MNCSRCIGIEKRSEEEEKSLFCLEKNIAYRQKGPN